VKRAAVPISAAFQLLFGNPILIATTFMFLVFNIGTGSIPVWLPILVETTLKGGPELYGILVGVIFAGQVASTLVVGQLGNRVWLGLGIGIAEVAAGLLMILVIATDTAATVGIVLFVWGIANAPLTPWAQTLRMAIIPEEMRGRAFALLRMLMQSGRPIGGALSGFLVPVAGIAATIALVGGATALAGVAGLLTKPLRDAGRPT